MEKILNTKSEFLKAFEKVKIRNKEEIRKKIQKETSWSDSTWYRKLSGETKLTNLESKFLNDLFLEYNINYNHNRVINGNCYNIETR